MALGRDEIDNRFGHHDAAIEGPNPHDDVHKDVRALFVDLAEKLDVLLPDGRGKAVMFTELETASMWAHKTLAQRA